MVRQHQELYDIDAPDYCNQDVRLRIWEIIGTKLGVTGKYNSVEIRESR